MLKKILKNLLGFFFTGLFVFVTVVASIAIFNININITMRNGFNGIKILGAILFIGFIDKHINGRRLNVK
ncbi:MAG TPA: hypothetical protein VIK72_19255 [Clostridiaceae bacterium]